MVYGRTDRLSHLHLQQNGPPNSNGSISRPNTAQYADAVFISGCTRIELDVVETGRYLNAQKPKCPNVQSFGLHMHPRAYYRLDFFGLHKFCIPGAFQDGNAAPVLTVDVEVGLAWSACMHYLSLCMFVGAFETHIEAYWRREKPVGCHSQSAHIWTPTTLGCGLLLIPHTFVWSRSCIQRGYYFDWSCKQTYVFAIPCSKLKHIIMVLAGKCFWGARSSCIRWTVDGSPKPQFSIKRTFLYCFFLLVLFLFFFSFFFVEKKNKWFSNERWPADTAYLPLNNLAWITITFEKAALLFCGSLDY